MNYEVDSVGLGLDPLGRVNVWFDEFNGKTVESGLDIVRIVVDGAAGNFGYAEKAGPSFLTQAKADKLLRNYQDALSVVQAAKQYYGDSLALATSFPVQWEQIKNGLQKIESTFDRIKTWNPLVESFAGELAQKRKEAIVRVDLDSEFVDQLTKQDIITRAYHNPTTFNDLSLPAKIRAKYTEQGKPKAQQVTISVAEVETVAPAPVAVFTPEPREETKTPKIVLDKLKVLEGVKIEDVKTRAEIDRREQYKRAGVNEFEEPQTTAPEVPKKMSLAPALIIGGALAAYTFLG